MPTQPPQHTRVQRDSPICCGANHCQCHLAQGPPYLHCLTRLALLTQVLHTQQERQAGHSQTGSNCIPAAKQLQIVLHVQVSVNGL